MDPEPHEPSTGDLSVPRQPPSAHSVTDVQGYSAVGDSGIMSQDTEVDMKEVELNELEPEKQPMNAASGAAVAVAGGGEKNGLVKIKVAEDDAEAEAAAKFTGLSKEELLKVAGSPGWVRTRWALLLLFWLGWLGMLAGAVVIIVQAPRCRELPAQRWWHRGALYRIDDLQAFQGSDAGNLAGGARASRNRFQKQCARFLTSAPQCLVIRPAPAPYAENGEAGALLLNPASLLPTPVSGLKGRLDYLSSLKVKGLVLGPIHKNQKDDVAGTDLQQIDPTFGSKEDFDSFLQLAKKKSIRVILDLTPNYRGQNSWFLPTQVDAVATKMKAALRFWLEADVDGFQVQNVENLTDASLLAEWQNITKSFSEDRLLIAGTDSSNLQQILSLLENAKDVLLTSSYLSRPSSDGEHVKFLITQYLNATDNRWCSWSLSQAGLLTSFVPTQLLRLYHLLLFTLPGTPVFSYGDEIGLKAATLPGQPMVAPVMLWDESSLPRSSGSVSINMTVKGQSDDPGSLLFLFRRLSDQRGKERSLLHGDFHPLPSSSGLFSYIRHWDQNEHFLVVLNFGDVGLTARLVASNLPGSPSLPDKADLLLSTQPGREEGASLELENLSLDPHEGLLLRFPYVA